LRLQVRRAFGLTLAHHLAMTDSLAPVTSIRPATIADSDILLEFRLAMIEDVFRADEHAPAWDAVELREANRRWLAGHFGRDCAAWLAEIDGQIAGCAAVVWFDHPPTPTNPGGVEAYILNVYTRPEWRRRGVARALMEQVVSEARKAGVRRIWLRASDEGRPLYEEMGFRQTNYLQLADRGPDAD
jgi:GNAT superfamily N-acetyltransferase